MVTQLGKRRCGSYFGHEEHWKKMDLRTNS